MKIYTSLYRGDTEVDGGAQNHPNLAQHLNLELSQKNMIFSKSFIQISRVVGEGSV